jgi:MarR family 2-MHQ and catechol resistance regulon transcriptional repressor
MRRKLSYNDKEIDKIFRCWIEITRIYMRVRAEESLYFEKFDLTIHQFGVLELLFHRGSSTIGAITKLILSTPGNITVVIKNLEKKGYIELSQDKKDKRIKVVSITKIGRELIESLFPQHIENMREIFSGISLEEIEILAIMLRKLDKTIVNKI